MVSRKRLLSQPCTICFPFIGDFVGGSHISALGLIKNLDPLRHRPLIVVHRSEGPFAQLLRSQNIPFEAAPVNDHLELAVSQRNVAAAVHLLRTLVPITRFLRRRKVDIVHTNDGRTHITWGIGARLAGAKLLWHHRADPGAFGLRHVAPWIAHRLVAVSEFASPPPGAISARSRSRVIHSPFDTTIGERVRGDVSRRELIEEIGCAPGARLLGYFGTLVDRKRPLIFVESIAAIHRLAPELDVHGLLFGDALAGLDEMTRNRADALGIGDRIHIMGFRMPGEPLLAAMDALLVTAVSEPFGRTLIEAMLLGTPVIAAESGGNTEAIRHRFNGILVPPDEPRGFAAAAIELLNDRDEATAMSARAARDARSRFSVSRHVADVSRVYEELLADVTTAPSTGRDATSVL